MLELNIAGLKTRVIPARNGPNSIVVMLHGYGAPGDDLVFLANQLEVPSNTVLVFPEAPLDLGADAGLGNGARGWWPIDSIQLQVAMFTGQVALASRAASVGRKDARVMFSAFMDQLQARFDIDPSKIVLGGFSQGAILCLDWVLHDDRPWAGLLCLSGTLVDGDDWKTRLAMRGALRTLISHGQVDPILPFSLAQQLSALLVQAGWEVEFIAFNGSHAIPPEVIAAVSQSTMRWLAAT
jgi:phospholipase/carboxylesterase